MATHHGHIWGEIASDYPTGQAEATYRKLIADIPESHARDLFGYGCKGAAYRYRAMADYQQAFQTSISSRGGAAPPVDEEYGQERSLFGFFNSGQACLESLVFAVYTVAACYRPQNFSCDAKPLEGVKLRSVAKALQGVWPSATITKVLIDLGQDRAFWQWAGIRNMLTHRMVPPRLIRLGSQQPTRSLWYFTKAQFADSDEPLDEITVARRPWLSGQVVALWGAIDDSFPPST